MVLERVDFPHAQGYRTSMQTGPVLALFSLLQQEHFPSVAVRLPGPCSPRPWPNSLGFPKVRKTVAGMFPCLSGHGPGLNVPRFFIGKGDLSPYIIGEPAQVSPSKSSGVPDPHSRLWLRDFPVLRICRCFSSEGTAGCGPTNNLPEV